MFSVAIKEMFTIHECDMTYFKSQRLSSLRALSPPADCPKVYYAA